MTVIPTDGLPVMSKLSALYITIASTAIKFLAKHTSHSDTQAQCTADVFLKCPSGKGYP